MTNQPITPEAIRHLADRLGSQAELARRLRVGTVTVWRWMQPVGFDENGDRLPGRTPTGLYAEELRRLIAKEDER